MSNWLGQCTFLFIMSPLLYSDSMSVSMWDSKHILVFSPWLGAPSSRQDTEAPISSAAVRPRHKKIPDRSEDPVPTGPSSMPGRNVAQSHPEEPDLTGLVGFLHLVHYHHVQSHFHINIHTPNYFYTRKSTHIKKKKQNHQKTGLLEYSVAEHKVIPRKCCDLCISLSIFLISW